MHIKTERHHVLIPFLRENFLIEKGDDGQWKEVATVLIPFLRENFLIAQPLSPQYVKQPRSLSAYLDKNIANSPKKY